MRYSATANYTIEYPAEDFMDGEWQDMSTLLVKAAFTKADVGADSATFLTATWHTDAATTPNTYWAQVDIGPTGDHQLTPGKWMSYLMIGTEVFEAGLIEVY